MEALLYGMSLDHRILFYAAVKDLLVLLVDRFKQFPDGAMLFNNLLYFRYLFLRPSYSPNFSNALLRQNVLSCDRPPSLDPKTDKRSPRFGSFCLRELSGLRTWRVYAPLDKGVLGSGVGVCNTLIRYSITQGLIH